MAEIDAKMLALQQANQNLNDARLKLLEDQNKFLADKVNLLNDKFETAINNIVQRLQFVETVIKQAIQVNQKQKKEI